MMTVYQIEPITKEYIIGFREAVDIICREKKYFDYPYAPPLEKMRRYVLNNIKHKYPHFVVIKSDSVIGWCDVLPSLEPINSHCGTLWIGLLPEYRGRGIGDKLIQRTLDAAFEFGMTRIELTVREQNSRAILFYKKHGFKINKLYRDAVLMGEKYENIYSMVLQSNCSVTKNDNIEAKS